MLSEWVCSNVYQYLGNYPLSDGATWEFTCASNKQCDISIHKDSKVVESHTINIEYAELNNDIKNEVNKIAKKISLEDRDLINYYLNNNDNIFFSGLNYMPNIKKTIKDLPVTLLLDGRAGNGEDLSLFGFTFGFLIVQYNGIAYGYLEPVASLAKNIIYIPDTTKKTTADYIKAISKRLKEYFPNKSFQVSLGGKTEYKDPEYYNNYVYLTKTDGNYYKIKINNRTYNFVAMTKKDIASLNIKEISDETYTGDYIKPEIEIKNGNIKLNGTDYTVAYKNNKNAGTVTITITGKDISKFKVTGIEDKAYTGKSLSKK